MHLSRSGEPDDLPGPDEDTQGKKKGRATNTPWNNRSPTTTKGTVDVILQDRGETGTRRQASPDPQHKHSPKREVQGVRE